jgi:hypothetical protein
MNFSPWPAPGKWFRFERNYGVHVTAKPDYGRYLTLDDLESFDYYVGTRFFLSMRTPLFRFYLGSKPITLADPGSYWRKHPIIETYATDGLNFFEPSARLSLGK